MSDGNGGANYNVTFVNFTTGTINTAMLTATLTAQNKTYDGTNTEPNANMSCSLAGVLSGDSANVSCAASNGTFNSSQVATANLVTATVTISGTAAGNYTLGAAGTTTSSTSATASASITTKAITATLTAQNKTYDGNNLEPDAKMSCLLTGVLSGDSANVSCAATSGTFNTSQVATANLVTATVTISGTAAGNYTLGAAGTTLSSTSATASASITTKAITATLTAQNKTYDGNNTEPNANMSCSLTGVLSGDSANVSCAATSGTFNTSQVATANLVTATVTISGTAAGNYTLGAAGTTTSSITATAIAHIDKADPVIVVTPYSVTYTGTARTATGTAKGVLGESLSGLDLSTTTHMNAGDYPSDPWTFTDVTGNYNNKSGTVHDHIDKADAHITVTPYSLTYDGDPHTATGSATGVESPTPADLTSLLHLGGTTHTDAGTYATDPWTFDGNTNYNATSGTVSDSIAKADPVVTATGGTPTYDGNPHAGSGTATGVKGESLTPVNVAYKDSLNNLLTSAPVNAGTYSVAARFPGNNNYNAKQSAAVPLIINQADAVINVSGYTGVYDGNPHGATGTAVGVESPTPANLTSLLHLGSSFTNVPGGTAHWTFDGNTNYKPASGDAAISITQADASITVNGYGGVYDGNAHGATGSAKGVKLEDLSSLLHLGFSFTNVPGGTAHWTFDGDINYKSASSDVSITISQADAVINVSGFTGIYDGNAHGATGSAKGVKLEDLSSLLNLGATFTDVPGGTAHWTFAGNTNYKSASSDVSITISQADQTITWSDPAGIIYGTLLSGAQLNATVAGVSGGSPAGALTYIPGAGSLLNAGANALTVNAASTQNYKAASATVHINVSKADQTITWATPTGIVYGTQLSGVQLNATVVGVTGGSAPGALAYAPIAGTILDAGLGQTLGVTAAETNNYKPASKSVSIDVAKGNQTINWNNPAGIIYGTLLGPAQLNAVVIGSGPSAIGAVSYSPANGIMLNAGNGQPLTVNERRKRSAINSECCWNFQLQSVYEDSLD